MNAAAIANVKAARWRKGDSGDVGDDILHPYWRSLPVWLCVALSVTSAVVVHVALALSASPRAPKAA